MEAIHALSGGATSPTSASRPGTGGGYKRKRSGAAEFESSPGTGGEGDEDEGERRRQPGVKRACNECRQQKVSHDSKISQNGMRRDDEVTTIAILNIKLIIGNYSCGAMLFKIRLRRVPAVID